MSIFKKQILKFKALKTSRKISIILSIGILLGAQIASFLCLICILNLSQLLSNIHIPAGYVYMDLDIFTPENMTVEIPYYIKNSGIYDLDEIELEIKININYINKSDQVNITSLFFSKTGSIGRCRALDSIYRQFKGDFTNFNIPSLVDFLNYFDETKLVLYFLDLKLRAKYFFNLVDFKIIENNINLYG